jgi:PRC-barrel domain
MIDKVTGKVAYAVISFGGFLGLGEDYYPMPWASLKYDTNLGGYRVGVTEDQLKGAPKYNRNTEWDWSDRSRLSCAAVVCVNCQKAERIGLTFFAPRAAPGRVQPGKFRERNGAFRI